MSLGTNAFPSGTFSTSAGLAAFFKYRYPDRKVESLVRYGQPTLEMLSQSDELTGIATVVPMQLSDPQGLSASLTTALQNASSSFTQAWNITPVGYYGGLTIDARTMMASRNNEGAFYKARQRDYEGILASIGQEVEQLLWKPGTGVVGVVSSTAADPSGGTTFTLSRTQDAINFPRNMKIDFYADAGSEVPTGAARAGGSYTVTGANLDTGVITVAETINAAVAQADVITRAGNANATLKGIPGWIPASDPSDTWFGVTRTNFPQMLGGWRGTDYGSIEESAKRLDAKMRRVAQEGKILWLSFDNFVRLEQELGARGVRLEDGGTAKFGRYDLGMSSPSGGLRVKMSPYVPENAGFILDMSTWKLLTLGALPHIVDDDGLTARVLGAAFNSSTSLAEDGIEIRLRYFAQLVCYNPFANGRFPIS